MPGASYFSREINENTFAIEEKHLLGQEVCYLLCGAEKALLIDTGIGFTDLKPTIDTLTDLPVVVANTNAHFDHIGGNHRFDEIWYHKEEQRVFALHTSGDYLYSLLAETVPKLMLLFLKPSLHRRLPPSPAGNYHYFEDGHIFHLGGRDVEVVHTPGHTPGSVCFLERSTGMLFSGDSVNEFVVMLNFAQESCPPGVYLASMQRLNALRDAFDTVWPGHNRYPVEKSRVDDFLACAGQIADGTAKTVTQLGRQYASYNRVLIALPKGQPTA